MSAPRYEFLHHDSGHDIDSFTCWCGPAVLHTCDECPTDLDPDPGCWKCGGRGVVPCDETDVATCDEPHIIVHRCDVCQTHPCSCPAP